jgi:sterol desaturase/sphingolipid hydroxylase (fatty acid hydroxylase superfamily)
VSFVAVLSVVVVILATGALFVVLTRTRRPGLVVAAFILVSFATYLRPAPGGWHSVTLFSVWSLALFWACIALERVRPRNAYPLLTPESLKSMALMPVRAGVLVASSSLIVLPWQHAALPSLSLGANHDVPVAVQVVIATVLADFVIYWIHRAQHASAFYWKFHMPHHATRELSTVANHRTNVLELALVQVGSRIVLFNLLGISTTAAVASNLIAYTVAGTVSHANIDFPTARWRWINYLLVTPNSHARHHALGAASSNFGETFACWDLLFRTFAAPDETMTQFGIDDDGFTEKSLLAQHLHPFAKSGLQHGRTADPTAPQIG